MIQVCSYLDSSALPTACRPLVFFLVALSVGLNLTTNYFSFSDRAARRCLLLAAVSSRGERNRGSYKIYSRQWQFYYEPLNGIFTIEMAAVKRHGASAQSMLPNRKPQYVVSKPPDWPAAHVVSPSKLCLPSLKSSYQVILDLKNISLGCRQVR